MNCLLLLSLVCDAALTHLGALEEFLIDVGGGDNNDVVEFEKLQEEMGWLVPNKGGRYKCWVIKAEPKTATRVLTSKPKLVLIFSCFCQQ